MTAEFKRLTHVSSICLSVLAVIASAGFLSMRHAFPTPANPRQAATEDAPENRQELCKKIIEKIYEAYGGRARISEIKDTMSIAYNRVLPQGQDILAASYVKLPDKMRVDMEGMETMVFDGTSGWVMRPATGQVQNMPPNVLEDFKRSSWAAQGMLNPEIMSIPPKLEGRASIDGKDYVVISYTDCGEFDSVYVYVDSTTFLPHLFAYIIYSFKYPCTYFELNPKYRISSTGVWQTVQTVVVVNSLFTTGYEMAYNYFTCTKSILGCQSGMMRIISFSARFEEHS